MRTASFVVAILAGCLIWACSTKPYNEGNRASPMPPRASGQTGTIAYGPASAVGFRSDYGGLGIQTSTGVEGSTEYTPFAGQVGGFPEGRGITFGRSGAGDNGKL